MTIFLYISTCLSDVYKIHTLVKPIYSIVIFYSPNSSSVYIYFIFSLPFLLQKIAVPHPRPPAFGTVSCPLYFTVLPPCPPLPFSALQKKIFPVT